MQSLFHSLRGVNLIKKVSHAPVLRSSWKGFPSVLSLVREAAKKVIILVVGSEKKDEQLKLEGRRGVRALVV